VVGGAGDFRLGITCPANDSPMIIVAIPRAQRGDDGTEVGDAGVTASQRLGVSRDPADSVSGPIPLSRSGSRARPRRRR
jgi:hypothetical protein